VYLRIPFGGLIDLWPLNAEQIAAVELVTVPGLLIGGLGVWALGRRIWRVEIAALLVNVVLFVVLLSGDSYSYLHDAQRISTCVVLAASYSAPFTLPLGKRARLIFTACAAFWVVPLAYWLVRTW
jgi:uncharacterized membrane protein